MTERRVHAEPRRPWMAKELRLVKTFYPHVPTQEIADELGREVHCVYRQAKNMGLCKTREYLDSPEACRLRRGDNVGAAHRYPKGHVPANKGTRRPGYAPGRMRETQFKKGQRPQTWKPLGSERLCDGYLQRKVTDTGYPPRDWKPVHVLLWEKAKRRKVGRGFCIVFKDGDKTHIELANLERVSRQDLVRRNSIHNLPPELKEVIMLRATIRQVITKRERKMQRAQEQIKRSA